MLEVLNKKLEKLMPLITPSSVIIGVLLGSHLSGYSYITPWVFAFMTFAGSLSSSFRDFFKAVRYPAPIILCLFILHLLLPVGAMALGHLFFNDDPLTITGLILAMAIPTGVSSVVWVAIYGGSTVLTLAIILLDTILSPLVVPLTLSFLIGAKVEMDVGSIMQSLFLMIVLPSLLGMALNGWSKGKVKEKWSPRLSPFSKLGMGIVVAINGAVISPYLREVSFKLLEIALMVIFLAVAGYLLGYFAAKLMKWPQDTVVAMMFNSGMRNISTGAVLAVAYFPPPVAIPVVLAMLFQQSLASLFGHVIKWRMAIQPEGKQ